MFTKTTIALALILATASGSFAAMRNAGTNPTFSVYDSRGKLMFKHDMWIGAPLCVVQHEC
jgi:hypothetical protein